MDAYTTAEMEIVKQIQRDRRAEAEATRRARGARRPAVPDAGGRATEGWPRRVVARFRALAWG